MSYETKQKFSESLRGNKRGAIPIIINGVNYSSKTEACEELNLSKVLLNKILGDSYIGFYEENMIMCRKYSEKTRNKMSDIASKRKNIPNAKPITINGITYETKLAARKALNFSKYRFNKLLLSL